MAFDKLQQKVKRGATYAGLGLVTLWVGNMVNNDPQNAKTSARQTGEQAGTGVGVAKVVGGVALSAVIDHSPVQIKFSSPLNSPETSSGTATPSGAVAGGNVATPDAGMGWIAFFEDTHGNGFGMSPAAAMVCYQAHKADLGVLHRAPTRSPC